MDYRKYASLLSQMKDAPCKAEDTEEMFWLRESDDYDSRVRLGNALVGQYRYKEAIEAYRSALQIRSDDTLLAIRIAGACLTIGRFDEAHRAYCDAVHYGATEKSIAYYMGVWHYLKGAYHAAADWFMKCLPCEDEQAVAAIYWHTLCCTRLGAEATLLSALHDDMKIGHHTAYLAALRVFCGTTSAESALEALENEENELNFVVLAYGLCVFLESNGRAADAKSLRDKLLEKEDVWPCISYLAAWRDSCNKY